MILPKKLHNFFDKDLFLNKKYTFKGKNTYAYRKAKFFLLLFQEHN